VSTFLKLARDCAPHGASFIDFILSIKRLAGRIGEKDTNATSATLAALKDRAKK